MNNFILAGIFSFAAITSCQFKAEVKPAVDLTSKTPADTKTKVRNNIMLQEKGLKVSQAFLVFEDGTLVPEANEVSIKQKVVLRLVVEDGYKVENGKVYIGASEKISTNTGKVFLDEKDLFVAYSDGVSKEDAQYITLSAVITGIDRLYDHFMVSFRLWDKRNNNEVTGSYKLYIK